ncbi:hypothetical protein [Pallidibacillus pasinlerensis]|uniref:Inner spore coat protein n=1 Tax=Pallidibacillus pasinlerensis TaxID=2703818 RepID=A0ABX0ABF7_9BACI|nr:hypothetical protein [Pallidibacillus pasinlerensis]NCU18397.1 hypothetical protein [Pallidibacillus pasinlerensis]
MTHHFPYPNYGYYPYTWEMPYQYVWPYTNYYSPYNFYPGRQNFPPVDTAGFEKSARQFQALTKEVTLFINHIISSTEFAYAVMDAAQKSDQAKVEQLIKSTGISIKYTVRFTPSAIQIEFNNSTEEISCCSMLVGLRW